MVAMNELGKPLSSSQVVLVLNDIAITAKAMQRFAVMLVDVDDERDIEALTQGIESMAERVGLLADRAAATVSGPLDVVFSPTVECWMMPPEYHDQAVQAQSVGGDA